MKNRVPFLGLVAAAAMLMSLEASAQSLDPGSLLLYPEFDNRDGVANALTITNTNDTQVGTVYVEFVYIDEKTCLEFNRTVELTPNDTLTVLTKFHNPEYEQGYVYLFAKNEAGEPIAFDWLIGSNMIIDGLGLWQYSTNPFVFKAAEGLADGDVTDMETPPDGIRDLDGNEYEQAPDVVLIPRFFGQTSMIHSRLIMIALSGGADFYTTVDSLIYNDNEEVFSAEDTFSCWTKKHLLQISGIFSNEFLTLHTNHDPNEILGANYVETGWMRINGAVANSTAMSIIDPAVLAILVEGVGPYGVADLPFKMGTQDNGDLLPRGPFGDQ